MAEFTAGILLPRSSLYTSIGADVFSGLKTGLKFNGAAQVRFVTDNIGFGGDEEEVYAKAEKMLLQDDPDLVIAFLDHFAAAKLEPLFASHNKLLLALDPGGHVPLEWSANPFRFTISLQAALGSRITARMAVENGAKKNIFATSFYEGGYLNCYSFLNGVDKAGGSVHHHDIVPYKLEDYSAQNLSDAVNRIAPDAILAQFSAEAGKVFLKAFADSGLTTRLYGSPFLLEEDWLAGTAFTTGGLTGCTAWSRELDTAANNLFMETIAAATGKSANVFHLLGWEAAAFSALFFALQKESNHNLKDTIAKLERAEIASPRGKLKPAPELHYFFSPMYAAEVVKNEATGNCKLSLLNEIDYLDEELKGFVSELPAGQISRWTNTYLCM